MKGLVKAAEAWLWMQVFLTLLALGVIGAGFWTCWLVLKYTAWIFGL